MPKFEFELFCPIFLHLGKYVQAFFLNYFLQVERTLRVRGDLHIGGLMIRLVDELGKKLEK